MQKEILHAGKIYISEGHICFCSNILGWVTNLVIAFEEVVSIQKEFTAMIIPNAIGVQTLHTRHTFRSLLQREIVYDMMINIWKTSHPAAFKKSQNSQDLVEEADEKAETADVEDSGSGETDEEDDEEDDEDDMDNARSGSIMDADRASIAGSDLNVDKPKSVATRKVSTLNGSLTAPSTVIRDASGPSDAAAITAAAVAASEAAADFPGPTTHAPTECTDTHYDKILKDEVIPAPLGKIYSMVFGPASVVFLSKYLVDEVKVTDLQFEDDKKGLDSVNKTRTFSYIKPLPGPIGPRQTKCIITEVADAFDLEKAVTITSTTQTPDVPSGNIFVVKTRFCLTWASGNATHFQMSCTIEWSGKSWIKGAIEGGANAGQTTYANDLVKGLRAAVTSRTRTATTSSKTTGGLAKKKKRKVKNLNGTGDAARVENKKADVSWGLFEAVRPVLGPIVDIARPLATPPLLLSFILVLLFLLWWRNPRSTSVGLGPGFPTSHDRIVAYEELWRAQESELWDWLEDRVGLSELGLGDVGKDRKQYLNFQKQDPSKQRAKIMAGKDVERRMREEKMSEREMADAIRVTQERLDVLRGVYERRRERESKSGSENGKKAKARVKV